MKGVGYVSLDSKAGTLWLLDQAENGLANKLIIKTKSGMEEVPLTDEMLANLAYSAARMYHASTGQRALMPTMIEHPIPEPVQPVARERERAPEALAALPRVRERVRTRAPA